LPVPASPPEEAAVSSQIAKVKDEIMKEDRLSEVVAKLDRIFDRKKKN